MNPLTTPTMIEDIRSQFHVDKAPQSEHAPTLHERMQKAADTAASHQPSPNGNADDDAQEMARRFFVMDWAQKIIFPDPDAPDAPPVRDPNGSW